MQLKPQFNFTSINYTENYKNKYNIQQSSEKFVNLLMKNGDKLKAYKIFYDTLEIVYQKYLSTISKNMKNVSLRGFHNVNKTNAACRLSCHKLFSKALHNVRPYVEVRGVKISGRIYQVPAVIHRKRQKVLAIRWLLECAKKRKKKSNLTFSECLASELLDAINKRGNARQNRDNLHKLAESNRAYMRFKWW